jgi:beta-N-acetylhexosaminidase
MLLLVIEKLNPGGARPLLLAMMLVLFGCSSNGEGQVADGALGEPASAAGVAEAEVAAPIGPTVALDATAVDADGQIADLLASMTAEQKIGQLLMPVLSGTSATVVDADAAALNRQATGLEEPAEIVDRFNLGGVLYLEENIESAEQLRRFSADLQQSALASDGLGLLVAVDQEGGRVNRITDQVTVFPSALTMAGNVDAVREASYITGQQLQRQGINVVLAPVADVLEPDEPGFIGDRSYGDDPGLVADMVKASIGGLQRSGVAAAVKHWPGHGATNTDSHQSLPNLDVDRELWERRERVPFDAAIAEEVAIVVVGHLAVPGLDQSGEPATVSSVLIDQLLRDELGFDGVVMTDALNMGAVDQYDAGRIAVDAVLAGADVLLVPPDLAAAYNALNQAVLDGELTADTLDRAVARVLALKYKLGLLPATT